MYLGRGLPKSSDCCFLQTQEENTRGAKLPEVRAEMDGHVQLRDEECPGLLGAVRSLGISEAACVYVPSYAGGRGRRIFRVPKCEAILRNAENHSSKNQRVLGFQSLQGHDGLADNLISDF